MAANNNTIFNAAIAGAAAGTNAGRPPVGADQAAVVASQANVVNAIATAVDAAVAAGTSTTVKEADLMNQLVAAWFMGRGSVDATSTDYTAAATAIAAQFQALKTKLV